MFTNETMTVDFDYDGAGDLAADLLRAQAQQKGLASLVTIDDAKHLRKLALAAYGVNEAKDKE